MIDENGTPRPLKVSVVADTKIIGSGNVVGEKAILAKTVVQGAIRKIDPSQLGGVKRERAGSEPLEMDSKKVKIR